MNLDATIVVLVLACRFYPWDLLENEGVRKTWCRQVDGLDIVFYYGGASKDYFDGDRLLLNCREWYDFLGQKTILAFEKILPRYKNLKYVFRTNLSSYVRLNKLKELTRSFNEKNFYAGMIGNHNGIHFASGCGYFISKDLMQFLVSQKNKIDYSYMDDVCLGKFLTGAGVPIHLMKRLDILSMEHLASLKKEEMEQHFHFRCKQAHNRMLDIEIMKRLHKLFG